MTVRTLFPRLLAVGFALSLPVAIVAQTKNPDDRQRYALTIHNPIPSDEAETAKETEPLNERPSVATSKNAALEQRFQAHLLGAIESHLGTPYRFNRTGPDSFDCSGLVWRAFNEIGVNFQRGPARSYWATFPAPAKAEQFKFGALVFFSGLTHVGIVADEKGFYHSSRRFGVMYSPFNDYWLSRIDGFRVVPREGIQTIAVEKRQPKPPAIVTVTDEGTPR